MNLHLWVLVAVGLEHLQISLKGSKLQIAFILLVFELLYGFDQFPHLNLSLLDMILHFVDFSRELVLFILQALDLLGILLVLGLENIKLLLAGVLAHLMYLVFQAFLLLLEVIAFFLQSNDFLIPCTYTLQMCVDFLALLLCFALMLQLVLLNLVLESFNLSLGILMPLIDLLQDVFRFVEI